MKCLLHGLLHADLKLGQKADGSAGRVPMPPVVFRRSTEVFQPGAVGGTSSHVPIWGTINRIARLIVDRFAQSTVKFIALDKSIKRSCD
jgi:hypothetical protein